MAKLKVHKYKGDTYWPDLSVLSPLVWWAWVGVILCTCSSEPKWTDNANTTFFHVEDTLIRLISGFTHLFIPSVIHEWHKGWWHTANVAVTLAKFCGQKKVHCLLYIAQQCVKHSSHWSHFQTKQLLVSMANSSDQLQNEQNMHHLTLKFWSRGFYNQ